QQVILTEHSTGGLQPVRFEPRILGKIERAMDSREAFERFHELQRYVGWNEDDVRRVLAAFPYVEPYLPELVEDFYAEIARHTRARKVITGGEEQVSRLKG